MPIQLGQITPYIEAHRAIHQGDATRRPLTEGRDFITMTEEHLREELEAANASPKMIEEEVANLKKYQTRMESTNLKLAREKLKAKQTETAQEELGEYFEARARVQDQVLNRKERDNAPQT